MKIYLLVFPIVFGVAAFGANHILAQTENKEVIPVVEVSPPEPKIEPVVEEKTDPELICLAMNIYHEARNQSMAGQMAVALVTMNRVNDPRYPNTICEVVMEGPTRTSWVDKSKEYPIKHRCQFSWYCDGTSDDPKDSESFKKALDLSNLMMHNKIKFIDITDGALFYHADYVTPSWAKTKQKTVEIQDHIFYRWDKK